MCNDSGLKVTVLGGNGEIIRAGIENVKDKESGKETEEFRASA